MVQGDITTSLVTFFMWWAKQQDLRGDDLLQLSVEACVEITECLEGLYSSDVWIYKDDAVRISNHGMKFLDLYRVLSYKSFKCGKALFPHMPKGHALDHIFYDLHASSISKRFSFNPLIFAVQMFEDYIGKCSRTSRRTSPRQVVRRVLERCLQASYKYWYQGGFIKDWWQHAGKKRLKPCAWKRMDMYELHFVPNLSS